MSLAATHADLSVRQHNFSAGPGSLPQEVVEEVRNELPVYPGLGASIMEVSHRSPEYTEIHQRAGERMKALLGYVARLQSPPARYAQRDLDAVMAAGWSEAAVFEAVQVAALFHMMNRIVEGTGVS
ncbi:MAG: hypothetical protein AAF170_19770, partial [Bacteroidota bacterium]